MFLGKASFRVYFYRQVNKSILFAFIKYEVYKEHIGYLGRKNSNENKDSKSRGNWEEIINRGIIYIEAYETLVDYIDRIASNNKEADEAYKH